MNTSLRSYRLPALLPIALCFIAQAALALPAPLSPQQLVERSDLVALVRVVSVTCTGVSGSRSGKKLRSYSAQLELLEVKKGAKKPGDFIKTSFREVEPLPGAWSVFYYPGEEVWTHLIGGPESFASVWWNARGQVLQGTSVTELPKEPGETVSAD